MDDYAQKPGPNLLTSKRSRRKTQRHRLITGYVKKCVEKQENNAIEHLREKSGLAATPFLVWGLLYLNAGITQIFLEMVKSGARDFNKTYRVVAYVGGTVAIFTAIPFLGELIGFAVCLPVGVYALAAAHGVPKSKVLLAIAAMWLAFALLAFVLKGSF